MIRTAVTAEEAEGLRAELRHFMTSRPDLSPIDLVQYTTLGECAGRAFLRGSLPGGTRVISELQHVLSLAKAGDILRPGTSKAIVISERGDQAAAAPIPRRRNMYQTETVRRVAEVLSYCAENAAIGVISADFGVGKSEAVKIWQREQGRETRNIAYEFDEFSASNKVDFVAQLAQMLGLEGKTGSQKAGRVFRAVCEKLCEAPALLILDQAESVRARVMQVVRQIWDRTHEAGVGVVILAAPVLLARMAASKMADLGALQSRVGIWAPLQGVTKNEAAAIVKQEGIQDVDEAAFDLLWRTSAGSMRRLMRAIDLLKAKHANKRISERTIVSLASSLWGMKIATEAHAV